MATRFRCHVAPLAKPSAFTLIELLVVVSIIALLISILLPAINAAKSSAMRLRCSANQHQLMTATLVYVNEFREFMPMPNWASQDPLLGWLYQGPTQPVKFRAEDRERGTLWRYLLHEAHYRCPRHEAPLRKSARLTSYLMNGSVAGYGRQRPEKNEWAFQVHRFGPEALIFWEAEESGWNDGSSYPTEGLTLRHGNGATVVAIDGHTEWMTHAQYRAELERPVKNKLWSAPDTANGR